MQCNSQTSLNKIHFLNTLYHFCLNTISWFSAVTWYDVRCECLDFWFVYLDTYIAFTTDFRTASLINLYLCSCQEIIFSIIAQPLPHGICYPHCQIPGMLWHPQYPRYLPPWAYCSIYCCFITETIAKDKIQCHRLWQDILCKFAYYCLHHVNSFGHFIKVSNSFVLFPFHLSKRNVILQNHIVQNDKKMHLSHN